MCIIVSAVAIFFCHRLYCEILNLCFLHPLFLVWYVICIFSPCESYFLWLEKIFLLQCEQIILCSPYCASKLVRPVYAPNNKSLSSEIKMPVRTKAETMRSSWRGFLPVWSSPQVTTVARKFDIAWYTPSLSFYSCIYCYYWFKSEFETLYNSF